MAHFNFQVFFCRAQFKLVSAGAFDFAISVIFWMNFSFHSCFYAGIKPFCGLVTRSFNIIQLSKNTVILQVFRFFGIVFLLD